MASLRVLILGGTSFVGRHLLDALRLRGHDVTLLNRGLTAPGGVAGVPTLHGDREAPGGLAALAGTSWDLVFDTSCYLPRAARATVEALGDVPHYVLVSSGSVYADASRLPLDEDTPVAPPPADPDDLTLASYGGLKAMCERLFAEAWPGRVTIVRAGIIVGAHDYDERFPWLLRRMAAGGEMIGPGAPDRPVQLIDARDLAAWMVRMAEARRAGIYNAVGPARPLAHADLLASLRRATGADTRVTWVPDELLLAHHVLPFSELPFWLPPAPAGPLTMGIARALGAGLVFRPLDETVADVWRWLREVDADPGAARRGAPRKMPIPAGLPPAREQAILAAFHRTSPTR